MPIDEPAQFSSQNKEIVPNQRKSPRNDHGYFAPLLDSEEAAAILKIHPKTLQKLARKGLVHGIHVGKLWRFRSTEIEQWINRQMAG